MLLRRLRITDVRVLVQVDLEPAPGLNQLVGANGAGKTSVLEAIYLLSRGRSFRSGGDAALTRRGAAGYAVYAELLDGHGRNVRLGLGRHEERWQPRVDGAPCANLGDLLRHCAVVCFEPGSHELLSGAAQVRRRFLDWGVFHVEHAYLDQWRRYQRALKQRNCLLRDGAGGSELEPWERELGQAAGPLDAARRAYFESYEPVLRAEAASLAPELGALRVSYRRGWGEEVDLAEALRAGRERDVARRHTTLGPHRADWRLVFSAAPDHTQLSRGQEKIAALACLLAQASHQTSQTGQWPILCLDDPASELDDEHLRRVLKRVAESGAQTWITGIEPLPAGVGVESRLFHVERGEIRRA